jgi:hypothetical protein
MDIGGNDIFRINMPDVISENIDAEVVILNLRSGQYFSTANVGADLWDCIENGLRCQEMIERLICAYGKAKDEIETSVFKFLSQLLDQSLIVRLPQNEQVHRNGSTLESVSRNIEYEPPTLNQYTDMQDLLLLDPIHDVDEMGWPAAKPPDQ